MELVLALENNLVQQKKENDHNRPRSKDQQASKHLHAAVIGIFRWDVGVWDIHIILVGLSVPIAKGGINLLTFGGVIRQRPKVPVTKIYHVPT